MEHINVLLLGKTGIGKSATGNSILRRKVFRNVASTSRVTNEIQLNFSEYSGKVIKVVDTPGLTGDLHESNEKLPFTLKNILSQAVDICPGGYQVVILVVKFNGHFTKEDVDIVENLKLILGQNFVKEKCILVMTHGDNFDNEELGSFKDWCSIQENDAFEFLKNNCNDEIILFDNKTKDERKLESQLSNLIQSITLANKKQCIVEWKRLVAPQSPTKSAQLLLSEKLVQESSLIVHQLMMIDLSKPDNERQRLEKLKQRAKDLLKNIRSENKTTVALRDFIGNAINICNSVEDQILTTQDAGEILAELVALGKYTKTGNAVNAKEIEEVKLMELRLKEDARKVEEENIDLISDWTNFRLQNA